MVDISVRLNSHANPDYRFRCRRDHGTDHPVNNANTTNVDCRLVVMMLFFAQYSRDGGGGIRICSTDINQLLPQMPEHYPLDGDGCRCDGSNTHQTGKEAEHVSSGAA
jgi:hypothetical protein